jgi:imidazolonepropionase-like amidohydrolase
LKEQPYISPSRDPLHIYSYTCSTKSVTNITMTTQILLQNGTVLAHQPDDTVTALRNTDILITNDKIEAIGASLEVPSSAKVIDCSGKIVSPGLISTHNHLWVSPPGMKRARQQSPTPTSPQYISPP